MILGALLLVAVFTLYPYGYALWTSTRNLSPILPPSSAGTKNYEAVWNSIYFGRAVQTTLKFILATVPLTVVLGVAVSSLLNRSFRGNVVLRAIVLLPWAIPAAVTGIMWKGLFNDTWGAVNATLYSVGIIDDYIHWLTTPTLAMIVAIVAHVWTQFPLATVLTLAAMQSVSMEQYESAAIDGANGWQQFRFITLPSIKGTLVIVTLYEFLVSLTAFDLIYSLTGGGPGTATTVIGYFIWSETFKALSYGRGSALAVMLALWSLIIIFVLLRFLPRDIFLEQES